MTPKFRTGYDPDFLDALLDKHPAEDKSLPVFGKRDGIWCFLGLSPTANGADTIACSTNLAYTVVSKSQLEGDDRKFWMLVP